MYLALVHTLKVIPVHSTLPTLQYAPFASTAIVHLILDYPWFSVVQVKARQRNCEISGYLQMKDKKWKKQWLEVAEFALYVFEKHEVLCEYFVLFNSLSMHFVLGCVC